MHCVDMVGLASPCLVHGRTIRNESNGNVCIRIFYELIRDQEEDEVFERCVEFQLATHGKTYIDQIEFDSGSFRMRETIQRNEVTRTNE